MHRLWQGNGILGLRELASMSERSRLETYEQRLEIYRRDEGICQYCGKPVDINHFETAHLIANTVAMRKKYGACVIDHILNRVVSHSGKCNTLSQVTNKPVKREELADKIRDQLLKE
jgi:hypothetical protein